MSSELSMSLDIAFGIGTIETLPVHVIVVDVGGDIQYLFVDGFAYGVLLAWEVFRVFGQTVVLLDE